jgi:acylphosphatase
VRNKKDGSVEAVFEGDKANVDSILNWCENGPRMAVVNDVNVKWEDYTGSFSSFDITF